MRTRRLFLLPLLVCLAFAGVAHGAGPEVAAGVYHSVFLKPDGTVLTVGRNVEGQLGDGTTTARAVPAAVPGLTDVINIAAGQHHTLALKSDGTVLSWGSNLYGALGRPPLATSSPVAIDGLTNVVAIAAGGYTSLAVTADGHVWAWGANGRGQVGDGETSTAVYEPTQVSGLSSIVKVAAGDDYSLAVSSTGQVYAWGSNGSGQLGDNSQTDRLTPVSVSGLSGVAQVAAGQDHSLALTSDGHVYGWGNNIGKLGDGTNLSRLTPVLLTGISDVLAIRAGHQHSLAVKTDGSLYAWGINSTGEVGDGTTTTRLSPVLISTPSGVAAIGASWLHSAVITSTGEVYAWGENLNGGVGDGTTLARLAPVNIAAASYAWRVGTPAFSPAAGTYTTTQTVTISCATAGATIHYTVNGIDPTESDPVIASGSTLSVTDTKTLKARAWKSGEPDSHVGVAVYELRVATPSFAPATGTYTATQTVALASTTSGSDIRYTTDGRDPTASSTLYTTPLSIATLTTVKARAFKTGWTPSLVGSATYTFSYGTLTTPTASLAAGTYVGPQTLTLSAEPGTTIRYTLDGSTPGSASPIYSAPLTIGLTTTVKARAERTDYTTSAVFSGAYAIQMPAPTLSLPAGTYEPGQTVTLTSEYGATIQYTISGIDPVSTDPNVASGRVLTLGRFLLKARAIKTGCVSSAITSAEYDLTGPLNAGPAVIAGNTHSFLLQADGTLWGWGQGGSGQVGEGAATQTRNLPIRINGITGVMQVSGGISQSLAVDNTGRLWVWGGNGRGQLGDGTTTRQVLPTLSSMAGIRAVAASGDHSLALTTDGRVYAWGANTSGQLGLGDTTDRWTPAEVTGVTGVVAIAAGYNHSLAITSDGHVWAWGSNASGQVGDGTTTSRSTPVLLTGVTGAVAISGGQNHSLALLSDGTVWAWGLNSEGQLGDTTTTQRLSPVQSANLGSVTGIDAGANFSVARTSSGAIWTWGRNGDGQLGIQSPSSRSTPAALTTLTDVTSISAGNGHTLALTANGTLYGFGSNFYGSLGDGTNTNRRTPTAVNGLPPAAPSIAPNGGTFSGTATVTLQAASGTSIYYTTDGSEPTDLSTLYSAPFAVTTSGVLKAKAFRTGFSPSTTTSASFTFYGTVPAPTASPAAGSYSPPLTVTLSSPAGTTIRYTLDGLTPSPASSLYGAPLVINSSRTLQARTYLSDGTASATLSVPYIVSVPLPPMITAGGAHTLLRKTDGTVMAWGRNYGGQVGSGTTDFTQSPIVVSGLTDINAIAAGGDHSLALESDGTVWAWGANGSGQLGIGGTADSATPVQITGLTNVVAIAAGGAHSVALTASGTVWTWGRNSDGQLGIGTTTASDVPVQVTGLSNVTAIAAGGAHTLARVIGGSVYAWGFNASGQLGDNSVTTRLSPVSVSSVTDVVSVAAGDTFSAALKSDGTLWTWGENGDGQLGDGTTTTRFVAVQVPGLTDITAMSAGQAHMLAQSASNGLYAWGANGYGQLGDGTGTSHASPVNLTSLPALASFSAGAGFSVAITNDQRLLAWGDDGYGQFGDSSWEPSLVPVEVAEAGLNWKVSPPRFAPGAGTELADTWVTVTTSTVGASVRYTTDGNVPTASSPVVPEYGIKLESSMVIRARAFAVGMPDSRMTEGSFTSQVAAPTMTPSGGVFNAARTVRLLTATSGATIRYTTNGTEPTASSTLYSTPLTVDQSVQIRAKAFRSGSEPSEPGEGTFQALLIVPVASPGAGTYSTAPTVTLTADPTAALYYTLNGAEPTTGSTLYTAPIVLTGAVTLKAKAFKTGWTPSATLVAAYQIGPDTEAPTITATMMPMPNTAGWHHTPVTVSFACQDDLVDTLSCTAPVTLSTEGASQVVNGTAQDASHTTSTSVTVNIDLTPPTLVLSSPANGATTSSDTIAVDATVSDALSGIDRVLCGGVPATVGAGGSVLCDAPLAKGPNTLLVEVRDVAGHSTTASVTVIRTGAPTTLTANPAELSLLAGQKALLQVKDDFGETPAAISWSSSDPLVADMSSTEADTVVALAAGTTTITATSGSLTVDIPVTVYAGTVLTPGATVWAAPASTAGMSRVYAQRVDADGPDIYLLDRSGGVTVLLGLRADGRVVYRQGLAFLSSSDEVSMMGDVFGGVLLTVSHDCPNWTDTGCGSLVRTGYGTPGTWQYRTSGWSVDGFVQTSAGDLWGFESSPSTVSYPVHIQMLHQSRDLVHMNGETGSVVSRTTTPQSYSGRYYCEYTWEYVDNVPAGTGGLIVGPDDDVYGLFLEQYSRSYDPRCEEQGFSRTVKETYQIVHVAPGGSPSFRTLESFEATTNSYGVALPTAPGWPLNLTPDSLGGLVATPGADVETWSAAPPTPTLYITESDHNDLGVRAARGSRPLIGNDGVAYIRDDSEQLRAFDLSTRQTYWTRPDRGEPVAARSGIGVALADTESSVIRLIDDSGATDGIYPMPLTDVSYWTDGAWHGTSLSTALAAVAGGRVWDETFFAGQGGNPGESGRPKLPYFSSYRPVHILTQVPSGWTSVSADEVFARALQGRAHSLPHVDAGATLEDFFSEIRTDEERQGQGFPIKGIGFIGHAVYREDVIPHESVGMSFHDADLVKLATPPATQWVGERGASFARFRNRLETQINVVFVGSCFVGEEFKSLWNIAETTKHQALIYPEFQGLTDLLQASMAWRTIATALANGETVSQAVAGWNAVAADARFRYVFVGDGSTRIAGKR